MTREYGSLTFFQFTVVMQALSEQGGDFRGFGGGMNNIVPFCEPVSLSLCVPEAIALPNLAGEKDEGNQHNQSAK